MENLFFCSLLFQQFVKFYWLQANPNCSQETQPSSHKMGMGGCYTQLSSLHRPSNLFQTKKHKTFPLILNAQQRWFYLIDAYLILLTIGASTQFPLYSNKVKTTLNLSQSSLTTIASFKNLGAAMGFLSGPLFGVFPTCLVIELSTLFNFTGHLFIHLVVSLSILTPKI